jgi:hypothetical protein
VKPSGTFAQFDLRFDEHPKYFEYGAAEMGLIACAITCSNRLMSDGVIPKGWPVRRFGPEAAALVERLVGDGVWRRLPDGNLGIVGYLDHNRSKVEIEEIKAKRAEAGKVGGQRSAAVRTSQANGQASASANGTPSAQAVAEPRSRSRSRHRSDQTHSQSRSEPTRDQSTASPAPDSDESGSSSSVAPAVREVFAYWAARQAQLTGSPPGRIKLTRERRGHIQARLREKYTVGDLKRAVDGVFATDFNVRGGFTDIELICRTASHVDRYMGAAKQTNGAATGVTRQIVNGQIVNLDGSPVDE